ncbi:HIT family protein [Spirochaetia bacterium]|nr:HIT family protein [Spirochaetia bacterium]
MKDPNCRYCTSADDISEFVAELEVSKLLLTKDQTYRGRCILALKDHKAEVFQMEGEELQAWARDLARSAKAIYQAVSPAKINYGAYGDTYPHFHVHLVPKQKDGKTWGTAFEMPLSADKELPKEELLAIAEEIKKYL